MKGIHSIHLSLFIYITLKNIVIQKPKTRGCSLTSQKDKKQDNVATILQSVNSQN